MSAKARFKTVRLPCGHHVLVPGYQTAKPEEYREPCPRCAPKERP